MIIGVDVSKLTLDVAALSDAGEVEHVQVQNDPQGHQALVTWLERFQGPKVALEATSSYHQHLVQTLQEHGVSVSVLNPAQVSYFVKSNYRRNKTDKADALWLALYLKERKPLPTPPANNLLSSLARELQALTNDLSRLKNRLDAAQAGRVHPEVVKSLKRRISQLEAERGALEAELKRETSKTRKQQLDLLTSIPGVGWRTACQLLAELGDINRFASPRKLVAFAGLTPAQFVSGSSVAKRSRITKLGSSHLRKLLYMPSLTAIRWNPVIREFFERLVARGKSRKAALVACMGKLLKIIHAVLTKLQPFRPHLPAA